MVVVVREGKKERVECPGCGSLLEYTFADIREARMNLAEYKNYIVCPLYDEKVYVK